MAVTYLDAIENASERIAEIASEHNLDAKVPSCPDWTLLDLVTHLGHVQEFWSHSIREQNTNRHWSGERTHPSSPEGAAEWLRQQTRKLCDSISSVGSEAPCWTWWGEPRNAGAVARHQDQEAEVHRWDAELAVGAPSPLTHEIAVDGLSEYLLVNAGAISELDLSRMDLVPDDAEGDWHIGESVKSTTSIRGTASDLVLFLYGRRSISEIKVHGASKDLMRLVDALPRINS